MNLPKDPMMLLSVVNTQLRDHYSSLEELCKACDEKEEELKAKLLAVGYSYNKEANQFR